MIAALAAAAFFGAAALTALSQTRTVLRSVDAELTQAELSAAAESGMALAIAHLGADSPSERWILQQPAQDIDLRSARLTVEVEDENAKIPINFVSMPTLQRLFLAAGAEPPAVDELARGVLAMRGDVGQGSSKGVGQGEPITDIETLRGLSGMTPELFQKIAPVVTADVTTLSFDPKNAAPLALAAMTSPSLFASQQPASSGSAKMTQSTADTSNSDLKGHVVSIRVSAKNDGGGAVSRTAIVEFTGFAAKPYIVRAVR